MFPYLPEGLDAFVDRVIPELRRRGIFRNEKKYPLRTPPNYGLYAALRSARTHSLTS
jgi:hypothetical protein